MTALFDARYTLAELPSGEGVVPAFDEMLARPVEIVLFDPVPDVVERGRVLRRLRRTAGGPAGDARVVTDSGSVEDRPFLVVPRERALSDALPLPVEGAVAAVLDCIERLRELRRAGLAPLSLRPELLRLSRGGLRILPAPGQVGREVSPADSGERAAGPDPASVQDVRAVGSLLTELLSRADESGGERLDTIAARATGSVAPSIPNLDTLSAQLRAWQETRRGEATVRERSEVQPPQSSQPLPQASTAQPVPPAAPQEEPVPAPRPRDEPSPPSPSDAPTELIRRAAPEHGARADEDVDVEEGRRDDAQAPYVSLSSLLHEDADEEEDDPPVHPRWRHLRQGPRHES